MDDTNIIGGTYDPGGVCVVRAGYEGVRRSSLKKSSDGSTAKSIRTLSSEPADTINTDIVVDEIDSIANAMDSINLNGDSKTGGLYKNVLIRDLILDFSNRAPDRYVINRGGGFLITVMGERFVVTCSHIMVRSAAWFRAYFKIDESVEVLDLDFHTRIPELDLVIMRFSRTLDRFAQYDSTATIGAIGSKSRLVLMPDLIRVDDCDMIRNFRIMRDQFTDVESIDEIKDENDNTTEVLNVTNYIINPLHNSDTGFYEMKNIKIERLQSLFTTLVTSLIDSIPVISIPLSSAGAIEQLRQIEERYGKKIEDAIDYQNKRSIDYVIINQVHKVLSGLSGSVIYSQTGDTDGFIVPIGMIVTFNIEVDDASKKLVTDIYAVPLDVIMTVIDNCLRRRIDKVMGIQVSYTGCIAEENGDEFYAAVVSDNSSRYVNGRKDFWFNKSDIIIKIDQHSLERDGSELVINTEEYGRMPINSYMFYRANNVPGSDIRIMIPKLYEDVHKKINYNITPIPYFDMFTVRTFHTKEIIWRGYLFLELSEEMMRFYSEIGIDLRMFISDDELYKSSANGERIVLLFNYNNCFNGLGRHTVSLADIKRRHLTLSEYKEMPCTNDDDRPYRYFYQLERVSNRTINHIEELDRGIDQIDKTGQKQITLLLRNRVSDQTIRMNV